VTSMGDSSAAPSHSKPFSEVLHALRRRLDRVTGRVENDLDEIARVAKIIDDLAAAAGHLDDRSVPAPPQRAAEEHRVLESEARTGALSLAMAWNVDGSADVRINAGEAFRVQAKPAALLSIIAAPGGRTTGDGLIGWRSSAEVAAALSKHTGCETTTRNVTQTIYKLRRILRAAGQHWFFVQTTHRGAVRFALRCAGSSS